MCCGIYSKHMSVEAFIHGDATEMHTANTYRRYGQFFALEKLKVLQKVCRYQFLGSFHYIL